MSKIRNSPAKRYLARHAALSNRPLVAPAIQHIRQVVVIPILAERESLPATLRSLAANPHQELERTLVIGVVNNVQNADRAIVSENAHTIQFLDRLSRGGKNEFPELHVAYVDAATDGKALPAKQGVGLARKIGMDHAVDVLQNAAPERAIILSLDADTTVEPNYLEAVRNHFGQDAPWAAVVDYAHPTAGAHAQRAAILAYEIFLRYHVLGLRYATSPYAFPSIGSTIACTVEAYVAVSGMNRRQAGEDFYFLQQLAKTGPVKPIHTTTVQPSARKSWRVPFGTGRSVDRFAHGNADPYSAYHPDSYEVLRQWLATVQNNLSADPSLLLQKAGAIDPQLERFLESQHFARTWEKLAENAPNHSALLAQFHRWFDGFKSLKLFHHLRENGFPDQDLFESVFTLLDKLALPPGGNPPAHVDLDRQQALLENLRAIGKT